MTAIYSNVEIRATVSDGQRARTVIARRLEPFAPHTGSGWDVWVVPTEKISTLDGQGPPYRPEWEVHDWFGSLQRAMSEGVIEALKQMALA
jgi:hypothetical protein